MPIRASSVGILRVAMRITGGHRCAFIRGMAIQGEQVLASVHDTQDTSPGLAFKAALTRGRYLLAR